MSRGFFSHVTDVVRSDAGIDFSCQDKCQPERHNPSPSLWWLCCIRLWRSSTEEVWERFSSQTNRLSVGGLFPSCLMSCWQVLQVNAIWLCMYLTINLNSQWLQFEFVGHCRVNNHSDLLFLSFKLAHYNQTAVMNACCFCFLNYAKLCFHSIGMFLDFNCHELFLVNRGLYHGSKTKSRNS